MTVVLFLLFTLSAFAQQSTLSPFAQQFDFEADGSFTTTAGPGPTMVNYTINWNETSNSIQGIYRDNYFAKNPQNVSGTISPEGRKFVIILPSPVSGVRQLNFSTGSLGLISGSMSLTTKTFDSAGAEIDNQNNFSIVSLRPGATTSTGTGTAASPDTSCTTGFGALTRMCGLYAGTINETQDTSNRCDLVGGNIRLELGTDTILKFHTDYVPGISITEPHIIGPFLPTPTSSTIAVQSRECDYLVGTTFPAGDCKTLNLSGTFSNLGGYVQFNGIYTLTDDVSGDVCSYQMNMNREVSY